MNVDMHGTCNHSNGRLSSSFPFLFIFLSQIKTYIYIIYIYIYRLYNAIGNKTKNYNIGYVLQKMDARLGMHYNALMCVEIVSHLDLSCFQSVKAF